jgi:cation transport regulator ChaB
MPKGQMRAPSTLRRSPKKAEETYEKTLERAEETYSGDEERAHRVAWSAVKHAFEKKGDHWEPKRKRGPSDPHAASGGPDPRGESFGGVDIESRRKDELQREARRLGVHVTSRMTKKELGREIERANTRATRKARRGH